jgi:hypothetical protein
MWKFVLVIDVLILTLLWMLAMVAITPAHNLLVVYSEKGFVLPLLTDYAIQLRSLSGLVPACWALLTIPFWRWLGKQNDAKRIEGLMAHGVLSLLLGFSLLFFFLLAGILPILKIGASIP